MRRLFRLPILLIAILAATGCTGSEETGIPPVPMAKDGALVIHRGNGSEPKTLDLVHVHETVGSTILFELYEGLLSSDADARLRPGVASRWDISDDGLVYTFHLRSDSRWSNGDPVVAQDFVASMRRYVDPAEASENAQFFYPVRNARAILQGSAPLESLGVQAIDDHTLRVELEQPTPWLLQMFATRFGYPIHRPSLEAHGRRFARPGTLVSNGPFVLNEWVVQSHIRLERNPHYWNSAAVEIDRVYMYPTEDIASEFKRYRAGELHYTREIPKQQIRWIRENLPEHHRSGPYMGVYFLPMDTTEPPFDDVRIRQALSMTVDRRIISDKVSAAGEQPATGLVPVYVSEYESPVYEWLDWPMEQRIAEARRLYSEAGYGPDNPLTFTVHYNTSQNNKRIVLAVAAMWKQTLGARVSILNQEWKVFLQTRKFASQWDMIRMGWIGGWDDPYSFLEVMLSDSDFNDTGWGDPNYDRTLEAANTVGDPAERARLLSTAEASMLNQYPVIPIFYYATNRLVRSEVDGYRINILDRDPSALYALGMAP